MSGYCHRWRKEILQTLCPLCPLLPPAPAWNFVGVQLIFISCMNNWASELVNKWVGIEAIVRDYKFQNKDKEGTEWSWGYSSKTGRRDVEITERTGTANMMVQSFHFTMSEIKTMTVSASWVFVSLTYVSDMVYDVPLSNVVRAH